VKFVENCEYRFFQRPDEAIHKGYDKQAEFDLASSNTFVSNFEPLTVDNVEKIYRNAVEFDKYSAPMKEHIKNFVNSAKVSYAVVSSQPRLVDGIPSKNMRYLQNRPDLIKHRDKYLAEVATRLFRKVPDGEPVYVPVNAVLGGRRNNPPEKNIRPLAVYNPIHYQELPELFMDFICSLTGKSPSTTGAGSEGALTKGPFNAILPIIDLNNALVSFILTGYDGYTTAAGFIGPNYEVGHDISLLVPEIWSRIRPEEREHNFLIEHGYLQKLEDFEHNGELILASRLGYRITSKFASVFLGRVFENPDAVFNEEILKPELQSMDVFVDGIKNITEAQKWVAEMYFEDGSINIACPPLKALLTIMAEGNYEGKEVEDVSIRAMFTRDYLLSSDWYKERLLNKQLADIELWKRHVNYLTNYIKSAGNIGEHELKALKEDLKDAEAQLKHVKSAAYLKSLNGYIGLSPLGGE
jgi:hypothetical protein